MELGMSGCVACPAMSIGDPCPKKKAGIFSGVGGSEFSAARHSPCVFGNDILKLREEEC